MINVIIIINAAYVVNLKKRIERAKKVAESSSLYYVRISKRGLKVQRVLTAIFGGRHGSGISKRGLKAGSFTHL